MSLSTELKIRDVKLELKRFVEDVEERYIDDEELSQECEELTPGSMGEVLLTNDDIESLVGMLVIVKVPVMEVESILDLDTLGYICGVEKNDLGRVTKVRIAPLLTPEDRKELEYEYRSYSFEQFLLVDSDVSSCVWFVDAINRKFNGFEDDPIVGRVIFNKASYPKDIELGILHTNDETPLIVLLADITKSEIESFDEELAIMDITPDNKTMVIKDIKPDSKRAHIEEKRYNIYELTPSSLDLMTIIQELILDEPTI